MSEIDEIVAWLEQWTTGPDVPYVEALIADWRKRGEALERARPWVEAAYLQVQGRPGDGFPLRILRQIDAALTPQQPSQASEK